MSQVNYCPKCGAQNLTQAQFCNTCGSRMSTASPPPMNPGAVPEPVPAPVPPPVSPPPQPQYSAPLVPPSYSPPPSYVAPPPQGGGADSNRAMIALVLGILGIFCCGPISSIPGIILAKMEMDAIGRGEAAAKNLGLAKAAFWVSIIATALTVIGLCAYIGLVGSLAGLGGLAGTSMFL